MLPDYSQRQEAYTVTSFLSALSAQKVKRPVYLTLPLTSHMVEHQGYRTGLLNWVTSFPEIDGIYLIVEHERETKQVLSSDFLEAFLQILRDIRAADLSVVVGYLNTEILLLSLVDGCALTLGTFENTRMFSIDKFLVSEEEKRRGPRSRIYMPGLLNWIQYEQAKDIRTRAPNIWRRIYVPTDYGERALKAVVEPSFNQPELYKHYLLTISQQLEERSGRLKVGSSEIRSLTGSKRRLTVIGKLIDSKYIWRSTGILTIWARGLGSKESIINLNIAKFRRNDQIAKIDQLILVLK